MSNDFHTRSCADKRQSRSGQTADAVTAATEEPCRNCPSCVRARRRADGHGHPHPDHHHPAHAGLTA